MIEVSAIRDADRRIKSVAGGVIETPLNRCDYLSESSGADVYLKCEHLQPTGSFKLRGAMNSLSLLDPDMAARGVIAASSGNHGLATALGASLLGIDVVVYVPETVSPVKLTGILALGAQIVKVPGNGLEAELAARRAAAEQQRFFVSPYNDPDVIAGQGTIGLELERQCEDLDAVIVAVGGAGLISGIGSWLKSQRPGVEIIGAWPEVAKTMQVCLELGRIVEVDEEPTLSDGTAGGIEPEAVTFPLAQEIIDSTVLVSEKAIADAMRMIAETQRWIIEGSAGVAVAAFQKEAERFRGKKVAIVVCGRNISLDKFLTAVSA